MPYGVCSNNSESSRVESNYGKELRDSTVIGHKINYFLSTERINGVR